MPVLLRLPQRMVRAANWIPAPMNTTKAVRAVVPGGELVLSAKGRAKIAAAELRVISTEMRNRKVNHGKHTSPTLCAWADRIDAIADKLELRS